MSFGDQLQILRRGSGLTQEEFAQQLQVSRQAVSKWESSRGYPEIEKIIYICNYYGVTMDELFAEEVPSRTAGASDDPQQPAVEQKLESPPLKKAVGDFFTNLSPKHQTIFSMGLAMMGIVLLVLISTTVAKGESDQMILKFVWLGLLILFGIAEAVTVGLTSVWFAVGSLMALLCALLGGNLWIQLVLFVATSALSMLAFRPMAAKLINDKVEPTNVDGIIGKEVLVTEEIYNIQGQGAVNIGGLTWSARSVSDEKIPAGTLVQVQRIEGVKVYVEAVEAAVKEEV